VERRSRHPGLASGFVVRVDTGFSNEGVQVQMMISQPFQFF
jgi:hypothetical protein